MQFFSTQTVKPRHIFSANVTGTPQSQLYVDGVASGVAVDATGADDDWFFPQTMPVLAAAQYIEVWATATVGGNPETVRLLCGSAVELVSEADLVNAGSDSSLRAALLGKREITDNGDATKTMRCYARDGVTPKVDVTFNANSDVIESVEDPA